MNYIKHLNSIFLVFYSDSRLGNGHISLYMALFFYWNLHHFSDGFYANRKELMALAKIGSRSTYHRLIKNLHDWEYIQYIPSKNPTQKTIVEMVNFCTCSGTDIGQTSTLMERYRPKNVPASLYIKQKQTNKLSVNRNPENEKIAVDFFKIKGWPIIEGSKFYNHYQGIGWKIGGKIPIVDWRATAGNWMLKAGEIKSRASLNGKPQNGDNLKTNNQKNYGEPL